MGVIRWLHLSDFHFGKDELGVVESSQSLLDHIKERMAVGPLPDFIFLTGDIANKGKTSEFEQFIKTFLVPLQGLVPIEGSRTFIVPGNHDIDRDEAKAVANYDMLTQCPEFFDSTEKGQKQRVSVFPRFNAFAGFDFLDRTQWVLSEEGYSSQILDIRGCSIGVLLLNTSWLSKSDQDKGKLRLGVATLKPALRKIRDCQLKIVLGHHPLHWLHADEAGLVERLLAKENALYFHGHLHKNESSRKWSYGDEYFSNQSGCVFQARDDDRWRNGFGWGAADLDNGVIEIEPMQWSRDQQEWVLDTHLLPNRFRVDGKYRLPFPGTSVRAALEQNGAYGLAPSGWHVLSKAYLDGQSRRVSEADKLKYFDGRVPDWSDILDGYVPERQVTHAIVSDIEGALSGESNGLLLIKGPGGEGKSTVLRQVALSTYTRFGDRVEVLWHSNHNLGLPVGWLPSKVEGKKIVLVSDEGDSITSDLLALMTRLQAVNRSDVLFLLATRDTDWLAASGGVHPWKKYVNYKEYSISGVQIDDAKVIVDAWSRLGKGGLGHLHGLPLPKAVEALVEASKSEAAQGEGALLGAMLRTRIGDELHSYVRLLLARLAKIKSPGGSLLNAFAYLVFPHADNMLCLSRVLLAELLRCKEREIRPLVVMPLGEEAAANISGDVILTRHRAIAEVAVTILCDEYGYDKETVLGEMVETAARMRSLVNVPYLNRWVYLAQDYEQSDPGLALSLALAACKGEPDNQFYTTKASSLLRLNGRVQDALELFEDYSPEANTLRGYFLEWGLVLKENGRFGQACFVMAISLLNNVESVFAGPKQVEISCANLLDPLLLYYDETLEPSYMETADMLFSLLSHDGGRSIATTTILERVGSQRGLTAMELAKVNISAIIEGLVKTNEHELLLPDGELPLVKSVSLSSIQRYREYVQRSAGMR